LPLSKALASKNKKLYYGGYMQPSHLKVIQRYEEPRKKARELAKKALPAHLKGLKLAPVDNAALIAFRALNKEAQRNRGLGLEFCFKVLYSLP
jgi:hypothetical protein